MIVSSAQVGFADALDLVAHNADARNAFAKLLERAAEEFSNHGCNDFKLPNETWAWELVMRMDEDNCGKPWAEIDPDQRHERPPLDQPIYVMDWILLSTLARIFSGRFRVHLP